jgi:hypothetical protein
MRDKGNLRTPGPHGLDSIVVGCKLWPKAKTRHKRWPNWPKSNCARRFPNCSWRWKEKWNHHRFLLSVQLHRLWAVEKDLGFVEHRIQEKLKPYAIEITLLDEIPGVDATLAGAIIAELGVDMSVFENVSQLASWAGVCPGNNESAARSMDFDSNAIEMPAPPEGGRIGCATIANAR